MEEEGIIYMAYLKKKIGTILSKYKWNTTVLP